jgi:gas vesicle protein
MSNGSRTFLAFLLGAATGAAIGILYAPDAGDVTRAKLRDNLQNYLNSLRSRLAEINDEANNGDAKSNGTSGLPPQDYRRAEELLREVEGLISEMKS